MGDLVDWVLILCTRKAMCSRMNDSVFKSDSCYSSEVSVPPHGGLTSTVEADASNRWRSCWYYSLTMKVGNVQNSSSVTCE